MSEELSVLVAVAALWALATLSPGPNFLVISRLSIARSRRHGMLGVVGTILGTAVWGVAGFVGIRALFVAAPHLYLAIRLLGAAYLVFMGLSLVFGAGRTLQVSGDGDDRGGSIRALLLGFVTTVANPRSAISVASIFATVLPPDPSPSLSVGIVALMMIISGCWYTCVVLLLTLRPVSAAFHKARRWIDRLIGGCLVFLGARLAFRE